MNSIMSTPCVCGWGGPGPCPCPRNRQIDNAWTPGLLSVFAAPLYGQQRQPWECPSCHTIHAPHVDRCTCKQPGLNASHKGRVSRPITVRGVTYASSAEAGNALGVTASAVRVAKRKGQEQLDRIGLNRSKPVTIRGVTYASSVEASAALGVHPATVRVARVKGQKHLDRVGVGVGAGRVPTPITIRGVTYASGMEAARALGVAHPNIYTARKKGQEYLDRIGLSRKDKHDG